MTHASLHIQGPLTTDKLDLMQAFSEACNKGLETAIAAVQEQYPGISESCAQDVVYLRTRSRHTPELEARLIREHAEGKMVLICDWPNHSDKGYNPLEEGST